MPGMQRGTEIGKRKDDIKGDYEADWRKQQMREENQNARERKAWEGVLRARVGEKSEYEGSSRKSCRTQGMKSAGRSTGDE